MTQPAAKTLDGRTYAIGVLTVTACVLFVGFLLVSQRPAQAIGLNDRAGDFKMLTQQISRTRDLLVIVDAAAQSAIMYDFDLGTRQLRIAATIPLDQLPKPPSAQPEQTQTPKATRRR